MSLTTNDIVRRLALKLNISQTQARVLLRTKLAQLRQVLIENGLVTLPGLGELRIKTSRARRNFIPGKDAYCYIPARQQIGFKLDARFKKIVRNSGSSGSSQ